MYLKKSTTPQTTSPSHNTHSCPQNPPKAAIRNSVNRGLDFLAERLDDIEDIYSLALTTYTLHLADHPHKDAAFFKLESKAKIQGEVLHLAWFPSCCILSKVTFFILNSHH